jgi:PhzF family phenazine biosynthesis protein
MKRRFKQVDVFTDRPFYGNPVAVVLDAAGLSTVQMQRIAHWTNLSETTFVVAPTRAGANYALRIFTPASELPFAGHPTIGSAHAVIEAGLVASDATRLVQECGAGLLTLEVERDDAGRRRLFVTAPPVHFAPIEASQVMALARALGASLVGVPAIATVGPVWLVAQLETAAVVESLRPDMAAIATLSSALDMTGVTVFGARPGGDDAIAVRSFAPAHGIVEDPVCGSGNISVAAYLRESGALPHILPAYSAAQGIVLGRDGHVLVRVDPNTKAVRIGGYATTCISGELET